MAVRIFDVDRMSEMGEERSVMLILQYSRQLASGHQ